MSQPVWRERSLLWRAVAALVAGSGFVVAAAWVDGGGTVVNGVADMFLVSVATLTYERWRMSRNRRLAEQAAGEALTTTRYRMHELESYLADVRGELDADDPRPLKTVSKDARFTLDSGNDNLRFQFAGTDLDDTVNKLGDNLDDLVRLNDGLAAASDDPDNARLIGFRIGALLDELDRDHRILRHRTELDYLPQDVVFRAVGDKPVPRYVYRLALGGAAGSAVVWLLGVWPYAYAADVLDNVLVGSAGILAGVAYAAVRERELHKKTMANAVSPRRRAIHALEVIGDWGHRRSREERLDDLQYSFATSVEDVEQARRRLKTAVNELQHLQHAPAIDVARDHLDDLVARSLLRRNDVLLMERIENLSKRMTERIEAQFPEPFEAVRAPSPDGQEPAVVEGLAIGCLVHGVAAVSLDPPTVDGAFARAWGPWPERRKFPDASRGPLELVDGIRSSEVLPRAAAWVSGARFRPYLLDPRQPLDDALAQLQYDSGVTLAGWSDLALRFLDQLPADAIEAGDLPG